jgi:hypothetical protein
MAGDDPAREALIARFGLRAVVAVLALVLATGAILTADRDPVAWAMPVLVLAAVLVAVMTLAGRGRHEHDAAAAATGLADDGLQTLPPVGRVLAGPPEARVGRTLRGELRPGGPPVRLARIGGRRDGRAVAVTHAPGTGVDDATQSWLAGHPLRPEADVEDGLLAVAAGGGATLPAVLDITREVEARMSLAR